MGLFNHLFGGKKKTKESTGTYKIVENPMHNRSIRVFVSSTFRDMMEERDALMTHCWPELRRFCRERYVELVEVDLRWGISEEQSTRKETLKLCLDEIRACRPFFIGLIGERYGWVPEEESFTADLLEEQPWIKELQGKSLTELEIQHGVLNNPEMADRSFFYFRDPSYSIDKGAVYHLDNPADEYKQRLLKEKIRITCEEKGIPLHENYPDPETLARLVLEQLKITINTQYPEEKIPEPLIRETNDHNTFAELRRKTYIARPEYYKFLDEYMIFPKKPVVVLGASGSGKSALLANWSKQWLETNPNDFIFQHFIGGTPNSTDHWKLMQRLIAVIKGITMDPDDVPSTNDDLITHFSLWLKKASIFAKQKGIRFIVILDALNQLDDRDRGRLLYWLPVEAFKDNLRLIVSTLPGDTLEVVNDYSWPHLEVKPLIPKESMEMMVAYLKRFSKELDIKHLQRIADSSAASNPLYIKILLDELRVTSTYLSLDERLNDYLDATDIPALLQKVLKRYKNDYEKDRFGLVSEALGMIWAARRGLTENELLSILRPEGLPKLPINTWAPLRAALEDGLLESSGILNFSHNYLRQAVEKAFITKSDQCDYLRLKLADSFEGQGPSERSSDELPWLLFQLKAFNRLRKCLLDIDFFLLIKKRNEDELRNYWIKIKDESLIGSLYLESFNQWVVKNEVTESNIFIAANNLSHFLINQLYITKESEILLDQARIIWENSPNNDILPLGTILNNKAQLLHSKYRLNEAKDLMEKAREIDENTFGKNHPFVARDLNNLAMLLRDLNQLPEAQLLINKALVIDKGKFGENHPFVARDLNNLALLLHDEIRSKNAPIIMRNALDINKEWYGKNHPIVANNLLNLAIIHIDVDNEEAEKLIRRAIKIIEKSYSLNHPAIARAHGNLGELLRRKECYVEAEPFLERALVIDELVYGKYHPNVAIDLNNLGLLLKDTGHMKKAEKLIGRALMIDEKCFGTNHPQVAIDLNNLAIILQETGRLNKAEPLFRIHLEILIKTTEDIGSVHPLLDAGIGNYSALLIALKWDMKRIIYRLEKMGVKYAYFKDLPNFQKKQQT